MLGRLTASQIASASLASFFCDFVDLRSRNGQEDSPKRVMSHRIRITLLYLMRHPQRRFIRQMD
jgi:hypothetical protein